MTWLWQWIGQGFTLWMNRSRSFWSSLSQKSLLCPVVGMVHYHDKAALMRKYFVGLCLIWNLTSHNRKSTLTIKWWSNPNCEKLWTAKTSITHSKWTGPKSYLYFLLYMWIVNGNWWNRFPSVPSVFNMLSLQKVLDLNGHKHVMKLKIFNMTFRLGLGKSKDSQTKPYCY